MCFHVPNPSAGRRKHIVYHIECRRFLKEVFLYFTPHIKNMFPLPDDDHYNLKISSRQCPVLTPSAGTWIESPLPQKRSYVL